MDGRVQKVGLVSPEGSEIAMPISAKSSAKCCNAGDFSLALTEASCISLGAANDR